MILAVEEENPALRFFFGCQFVIRGNYGVLQQSESHDQSHLEKRAFHGKLPICSSEVRGKKRHQTRV
jgi:hypothetical protein